MQLSKKQKKFLKLFCAFLKSRLKFEHFEKKKTILIAYVFPKLQSTRDVIKQI